MASNHQRNLAPMQSSPRCQRIKRNGECCRAPAVTTRKLCRAHGGKAGAPKGNRNALKDGLFTKHSLERDRITRTLLKEANAVLKEISAG